VHEGSDRAAEQDRATPGVRAQVHAVEVVGPRREPCLPPVADRGQGDAGHPDGRSWRPADPATRGDHTDKEQREQEVELLLDRQRPGVLQRARRRRPVGRRAERHLPVPPPRHRGDGVADDAGSAVEQHHGGDHDDGRCGQQSAPTPGPPPTQVACAVRRVVEQQQRDEETRQDEEALECQETAEPRDAQVVAQHDRHEQATEAVETRHVAGHPRSLRIVHAAGPARSPPRCSTPESDTVAGPAGFAAPWG
jgi:hypothetical protein